MVSITFDDFPRSAWIAGGTILAEFGVHGTYYAAMGLMGKRTPVGEMFLRKDLESAAAAGHELACHTYDHALCCNLNARDLLSNCEENQRRMAAVLDGYKPSSFSFPEGVVTLRSKRLVSGLYDSCRTIEPGINTNPVDLGFLRANRVYSTTRLQDLKQLISANRERAGWLILYTHDISSEPSPWGCTADQFRQVVSCAVESGAEILPVGVATKRFTVASRAA